MCEPLRGKKTTGTYDYDKFGKIYKEEDVKSAVDFYKKYKDNLKLLKQEKPNVMKILDKETDIDTKQIDTIHFYGYANKLYNDWLFDYCFKDVMLNNRRNKNGKIEM